jgi:hypothetical protein
MKDKTENHGKVSDRKKKLEGSRNTPSPFRTRKETETTWSESRPSTAKKHLPGLMFEAILTKFGRLVVKSL